PALVAEFVEAIARTRSLLRRCSRRVIVGAVGFVIGRLVVRFCGSIRFGRIRLGGVGLCSIGLGSIGLGGIGFCRLLGILGARVLLGLVAGLVGFLGDRLADGGAVVDAEHHHDRVRLLGRQDLLGGSGPVRGLAARLVLDQTAGCAVLADHA